MSARAQIKAAIKRQGKSLHSMRSAEITRLAREWLAQHPDRFIPAAKAKVERMVAEGVFGKKAQRQWCASLETAAQKQTQPNSIGSAVQISGAK